MATQAIRLFRGISSQAALSRDFGLFHTLVNKGESSSLIIFFTEIEFVVWL